MHHILKTARCGGQLREKLGSYRQLVRTQRLVRQQQQQQQPVVSQQRYYHAEELGVYGYKPSPPTAYQGKY